MAQEYGTDLIALEKPALMHPAFFGYLTLRNHRPACDPAVLHPIFFNHKHIVVRATGPPQAEPSGVTLPYTELLRV